MGIFGGGLSKAVGSFLDPAAGYRKAEKASKQYYDEAKGYELPYLNQGQDQYGRLNTAENNLLDPTTLENQWAGSYEQSPYAKQLLEQNRENGLEAASSMGLMGSSAAINNIQKGAGDIVNSDRQQFLNDIMQKYLSGIGIGSSIYGVGANAANTMFAGAQKQGDNMAGLEYGRQAAPGAMIGNLLGKLTDMGANFATGGMSGGGSSAASYTG